MLPVSRAGDTAAGSLGQAHREGNPALMDRILIDDLRVLTVIGALEHERQAPQPLRIDLSVGVDLADAGRSDELDDTVNYGLVAERVTALAHDTKHVLLERLAADVADVVLAFDRVEQVEVTITKLRPPIPAAVESTAVHIVRTRAQAAAPPLHRHEAIVALGSNLGDREAYLRYAVGELGNVTAMSQVFETEPIGGPDAQGAYLNMVVKVETSLDPYAFIRRCQRIEAGAMRQRTVHWGPRTLDVDLLFYDDVSIVSDELTVPHPRVAERRFVLTPLSEVAPERCPADWDATLPPATVLARGPLG
jgi:dihydroneopterin aldolase/2-amino-4-hydroxy-6-hydroxymethyldihydropteridine diphosphokinase